MNAFLILIDQIISIYLYTLIVYVILTLLIQYDFINRYNRLVDKIVRALIALHEPLLIQVRRFVPFIGGMDFSPVIVILLLSFFRNLIKQNLGIWEIYLINNLDKIIDGKLSAYNFLLEVSKRVNDFENLYDRPPCLAVIIVGNDTASKIYVKNKIKTAKKINVKSIEIILPKEITEKDLLEQIDILNDNELVDGILVQLPLPKHFLSNNVTNKILPLKDVDGFHPLNFGNLCLGNEAIVPCTPLGCLYLIKNEIKNLSGYNVTIVGRSNIVGKPMQALLIKENCTVTLTHSRTRSLVNITKKADILISAIGRPEYITKEYIKPNSIIIDVGINRVVEKGKNKLVGDVKFEEACQLAKKITPVPGGVGPMTIACLMYNTVKASFLRKKKEFKEIIF